MREERRRTDWRSISHSALSLKACPSTAQERRRDATRWRRCCPHCYSHCHRASSSPNSDFAPVLLLPGQRSTDGSSYIGESTNEPFCRHTRAFNQAKLLLEPKNSAKQPSLSKISVGHVNRASKAALRTLDSGGVAVSVNVVTPCNGNQQVSLVLIELSCSIEPRIAETIYNYD